MSQITSHCFVGDEAVVSSSEVFAGLYFRKDRNRIQACSVWVRDCDPCPVVQHPGLLASPPPAQGQLASVHTVYNMTRTPSIITLGLYPWDFYSL